MGIWMGWFITGADHILPGYYLLSPFSVLLSYTDCRFAIVYHRYP